jgi:thymidine kinase
MFSSKSSLLLQKAERDYIAKKKVVIVRPLTDTRDKLTHTGAQTQIPVIQLKYLADLDGWGQYDSIFIDEGQFFGGLKKDVNYMAENGKKIVIAALNGDSDQGEWDEIQQLIPWAEEIIKLNAVCTHCGSEYGSFSYYQNLYKTEQVLIGDSSNYIALCRKCLRDIRFIEEENERRKHS